ncbi:hypothetical protein BWK47_11205 [Synechocystis sp. CACIAM 05]|nr:hypothetical protein BWK47_11205 [Synechocystis sp. CACIAM 05]
MGNGDNLKILAGQGWGKHSCLSIQTRAGAENCLPGTKFFAPLQCCEYFAESDCRRKPQAHQLSWRGFGGNATFRATTVSILSITF